MNRRNFLGLGLGLGVAAVLTPATLSAVNFRDTKPKAWSIMNKMDGKKPVAADMSGINSVLDEMYGTHATTESGIKLKAPAIAENGAVIPLSFKSSLKAKTISVFQTANPEPLVAVFTVPADGIVDYSIRIKMGQTATIMIVAEVDGKLHSTKAITKVTAGGCGG